MSERRRFWQSLKAAGQGIKYTLKTQRNMRVHTVAATIVLLTAWVVEVSPLEWVALLLTIVSVMAAEIINTAVEATVDLFTGTYHPLARTAKNAAAGAVLLTAINAVVIGVIIFYQKILALISGILF